MNSLLISNLGFLLITIGLVIYYYRIGKIPKILFMVLLLLYLLIVAGIVAAFVLANIGQWIYGRSINKHKTRSITAHIERRSVCKNPEED